MARQPMAPGTWGHIHVGQIPDVHGKPRFKARTRVRDQDGKTRQVSAVGASRAKAEQALKAALVARTTPAGSDGGLTRQSRYRELAADWLRRVEIDRARTTYDSYRRVMESTVLPRFGDLTIAEVTGQRVDAALTDLAGRYTPNGVRQIKKVISGPLALARSRGIIDRNPVRDLDSIEGRAAPPRALTEAEEDRLLAFLDTDRRARDARLGDIVRFLLGTGARIGEALGLVWGDVDLDAGIVRIRGSLVRVAGVGLARDVGKSDAARRTLRLPPDVVAMLREIHDPTWMTPDRPVFPSSTGRWRDLNNIQKLVRYVRGRVDGLDWISTHTFRRTVATRLDAAGFSPMEIANQLGHSRPSMSQDVYMDRSLVGPQRASEVLGRAARLPAREDVGA
jgi:integrase